MYTCVQNFYSITCTTLYKSLIIKAIWGVKQLFWSCAFLYRHCIQKFFWKTKTVKVFLYLFLLKKFRNLWKIFSRRMPYPSSTNYSSKSAQMIVWAEVKSPFCNDDGFLYHWYWSIIAVYACIVGWSVCRIL